MALATTCPQCKTSFRVVPDQLKLRRGFVRCGRCRHVFAGVDHLRYVDDAQLRADARTLNDEAHNRADAATGPEPTGPEPTGPEPIGIEPTGPEQVDAAIGDEIDVGEWIVASAPAAYDALFEESFDVEAPTAQSSGEEAPHGETLAMNAQLVEVATAEALAADASVADPSAAEAIVDVSPAEEALDEPPPPPWVERHVDSDHDERNDDESAIDYFATGRARGFADRRGLAAGLLALALTFTLALQWVVAQRSAIAMQLPFAAPLLGAALGPFGLRIEAPDELDALTIESFELQASAVPDVLEMRALLRNRADHPVRWPSMQLTLTDPSSRVLVRRALHPDDYLQPADEARGNGVPARTEWPLRLALEARDLQATGYDYRVQLFYSEERR